MAEKNVFPVFIKAEYTGDDPFDDFSRYLERATTNAKKQFGAAFRDIETSVSSALNKPLNASGALNLDPAKMRAAADAAKINALALKEVARAAENVAQSDPSAAFRRTAVEAANAALVAEKYSQSVASQALVMDRLQAELNQTKSATIGLASAQKGFTGTLGAQKQAYVGVGQQLQDIVISMGAGQRASTVLAQQLPQLAFQLKDVGGTAGRVASVFAGPWGIALAAGAFALGPLIDNLFKTEEAADGVKFATNAMGEAQGFLASVLDLTTGKITTQSQALQGLAKAQLLVAQVNAQTRAAEAKRGVQDIQSRGLQFSGGIGGGFSVSRRPTDARDVISQQVLAGNMTSKVAVERLDNLRLAGKLTDDQFANAAASVANLGVELENLKVFGEASKLLDGTGGKSLLKPGKTKKAPKGRTPVDKSAAIAEFGEDTASKIAGIADSFGEAPGAIVRANKALRQLDDLQSDILRKKPLNIDTLLAQLSEARAIVGNSLSTAFDKIVERGQDQARIQELINTGREREADVLQTLASLGDLDVRNQVEKLKVMAKGAQETLSMADATADEREKATAALKDASAELDKLNPLAERQFKWAQATALQRERDTEAAKRLADQLGRYQSVVDGTYRSLEDLLSGGSGGDFLKSIREQFKQLRGANLADSLFGDAFAELRKFTDSKRPENQAVANLVEQVGKGSTAVEGFADAVIKVTDKLASAANDNPYAFPAADVGFGSGMAAAAVAQATTSDANIITVLATLKREARNSERNNFAQFASVTATSIVQPMLAKLDDTFGTSFFAQMTGALSGALAGYARAGNVGGVLGAGQGIFDTLSKNTKLTAKASESLSKISGKFGQALGGAQTGDQTAQLLRAIGVKTSRTGGQIGGAVGSFLPIPGGEIIGSVIGSVVGGLFKKTPRGSTTITNTTSDLSFSGSKKLSQGVLGLGGNVQSGLANIIQTLGGTAGNFGVSIGQRGKDFVVDPTGKGRTKGSGVLKFKDEQEAARAALLDAINDGAVIGIRQGAQNLLRAGRDIEKQLAKAADFQGVFDRLKQREDPLGFALDVIDRDFTRLRNVFLEASASAADYAALEKLYGLERADAVEQSLSQTGASLKDFLSALTAGNDARSLRERQEAALKEFDPLAARVASGDKGAYDEFAQIAQQLLDIERQIYGSQAGYFTRLNQVTDLTKTRVDADSNVSMIGELRPGIFGSASPNNDTAPLVGAIMGGNANLLEALNRSNEINLQNGEYLRQVGNGGSRLSFGDAQRQYY